MGISDSETTSHISGTPLRPDGLGGFILSVYTRGHMKKEIKSTLARLLATENLLVEHKQVPTASFDVHKRLLTLPMWNRASDTVYDLLVGHEVGHALYTPDDDTLDNLPCPKDYLNVTEDARIEKLMKRKYPGLAKDFYRGYQELNDDDFFAIEDQDRETLSLIDRINLHYKIGAYALMPFNASETPLCAAVGDAETFEEAIAAAVAIYEFAKKEQESKPAAPMNLPPNQGGSGMTHEEMLEEAQKREQENEETKSSSEKDQEVSRPWFTEDEPDTETERNDDDAQLDVPSYEYIQPNIENATTQRNFDRNASELIDKYANEFEYVTFPKINFKNTIVPNTQLWDEAEIFWEEYYEDFDRDVWSEVDSEFTNFCNNTSKDVNYLVKEFECKKSATSYARSSTARTGVLDTNKLHNYKLSEDIFKKVTRTTDGKNHGLVFLLDWSGSMANEIFETICQVINLAQFCKKVGIPFDVYTFVNDHSLLKFFGVDSDTSMANLPKVAESGVGAFWVDPRFKLVNVLTSEGNQNNFKRQCNFLYRVGNYWNDRRNMYKFRPTPPPFMGLGGTPLNEALIVMREYLGVWQKKAGVEKSHLVVLTDGESQCTWIAKDPTDSHYFDEPYPSAIRGESVIRTKNRYYSDIKDPHQSMTRGLIRVIRDTYPECSVMGFRICSSRHLTSYLNALGMHGFDVHAKYSKMFRRDKSVAIVGSCYNELYCIQSSSYNSDVEMDVAEDATKGQIRSAFKKSLKSKSINRKMLSSFAGQIA